MQKHNKQQYEIIKRIYRKIKSEKNHKQQLIYKTYICDNTTNKTKYINKNTNAGSVVIIYI